MTDNCLATPITQPRSYAKSDRFLINQRSIRFGCYSQARSMATKKFLLRSELQHGPTRNPETNTVWSPGCVVDLRAVGYKTQSPRLTNTCDESFSRDCEEVPYTSSPESPPLWRLASISGFPNLRCSKTFSSFSPAKAWKTFAWIGMLPRPNRYSPHGQHYTTLRCYSRPPECPVGLAQTLLRWMFPLA